MDSITAAHINRRFAALVRILDERADSLERRSREAWRTVHVGYRFDGARAYTVTELTETGVVVRFDDGEVRSVDNPWVSIAD